MFTVNTCTRADVFTVVTTKDQPGGRYNSHNTDGQGFMTTVNKPRPQATCKVLLFFLFVFALFCFLLLLLFVFFLFVCLFVCLFVLGGDEDDRLIIGSAF